MPLDINTIRAYKGGDPEKVRESQRRRFADVTLVDKVIAEDEIWRKLVQQVDDIKGRPDYGWCGSRATPTHANSSTVGSRTASLSARCGGRW